MAGTASDGELNASTPPIATKETTDPSGGAIRPSLDGAGQTTLPSHDNIDNATTEPTAEDCPTSPISTVPVPSMTPSEGVATTDPEPYVAPPATTLQETPIDSEGATGEDPHLVPEQTAEFSAATGEDPSLVPEQTADITTPLSGVAAENAASLLPPHTTPESKIPNADPDGVVRRPRTKRGRPQEALTFGAKKQEAIHNQNQAPPPPPPEATVTSSPPREGATNTVEEESTPPPSKRVKKRKNEGSTSSSAQMSSPPLPSPPEAAKSDSQVWKNRKDKDGKVKWYFSSGGTSSLRKGQHLLHPPPPPPNNPPVYGPQLPFPCSICGRGFYTIRSLCGHMKAHPGRAWRGAFPPPENMIPTLAPPVLGAGAGDNGNDGTDGNANAETEEVGGQNGQSMPKLNDNNEGVGHDEEPASAEVKEDKNEEPAAATADQLLEDRNEGVEDEEPAAVTADQLHEENEGAVHEEQPAVAELHEDDKGVVHEESATARTEDNEGAVHEQQPAAVVELHVVNEDPVVHAQEEPAAAEAEAENVVVQEVIRGSDGKIIPDLNGPAPTDSDEDRSNG